MSSSASTVDLCVNHPAYGQRSLATLTRAPAILLWLILIVLLLLLVRTVRRHGPFDLRVTRGLRFLAWFTPAATFAVNGAQAFAAAEFTVTADPNRTPGGGTREVPLLTDTINGVPGTSWIPLLLVMCGLLTLARIIVVGAQMHEDLAGTI